MVAKLLEIKNRTYYFWDGTIKIEGFNPSLLKLDKKSPPINTDIYYIGCVTKNTCLQY